MGNSVAVLQSKNKSDSRLIGYIDTKVVFPSLVQKLSGAADLFSKNKNIREQFVKYIEDQEWLYSSFLNDSFFSQTRLSAQSLKIVEEFCFINSEYASENYDKRIENNESTCFCQKDMNIVLVAMLVHPFLKKIQPHLHDSEMNKVLLANVYGENMMSPKHFEGYEIIKGEEHDEMINSDSNCMLFHKSPKSVSENESVSVHPVFALKEKLSRSVQEIKNKKGKDEICEVLRSKKWVEQLLEAMDDCRFNITVASARERGFPFVYVNKAFEKTTGNFHL
jgi:hypothetical protein